MALSASVSPFQFLTGLSLLLAPCLNRTASKSFRRPCFPRLSPFSSSYPIRLTTRTRRCVAFLTAPWGTRVRYQDPLGSQPHIITSQVGRSGRSHSPQNHNFRVPISPSARLPSCPDNAETPGLGCMSLHLPLIRRPPSRP
ncbi:hypothetical protein LZ30DRAFT_740447 [Colletotrichum cereale]|nr:hypothetical protein LZ30DRAFT_740447 [Colletotrichum cereale]